MPGLPRGESFQEEKQPFSGKFCMQIQVSFHNRNHFSSVVGNKYARTKTKD